MSENVVLLIANIDVILAWVGCTLFILFYSLGSPWRSSLVGRTLMYSSAAMWALLTYAFTARWLEPNDNLNYALALGTYTLIAFIQWSLFFMVRLVQTGRVSPKNPNYTPIRDWLRRRREQRRARTEK